MNHTGQQTKDKELAALLPAVLVAAWWLLTRPYHGLWHDGVFYAVQALKNLHPELYARDVFFMYGSQDDFTLFGRLQAWLTGILGMERTFRFLYVAGAVLWLSALVGLMSRWLSGVALAAAVILVLSLDSHYAGFGFFSYGEGFATPRIFSEALVLLALSWWLEARRLIAVGAVAGAALLHPLIALAGAGVLAWSTLRARLARPLVLWMALLCAGLLGMQFLVWMGISPRLDPLWRSLVEQRSPFVFPQLWNPSDWLRLALDGCLLWLAARHLHGEAGKLAGWILPVLALAMLWALAAGLTGVQLAVAVQLQRIQWLAHLLALALVVPVCLGLWQTSDWRKRYLAIGVAGSLVFPFNLGGLILPVVYGLYRWDAYRSPDRPLVRGLPLILLISIPLAGLVLWLFYFASNLMLVSLVGSLSDRPTWLRWLVQPPVALGVFLGVWVLSSRLWPGRGWLWLYSAVVLAVGILHWKEQNPWCLACDQPERRAAIAPVQAMIPKGAVVYWESGVFMAPDGAAIQDRGFERAWFWLRRANYASFDQAAGIVFYRDTAVELARRLALLRRWGFRDSSIDLSERGKPPPRQPLTLTRLKGVCSDPVLDYVITDSELPFASLSFRDPLMDRRFSVYDCGKIKGQLG